MKKSEVTVRWDYGVWRPAINVKHQFWLDDIVAKFRGVTAVGKHGTYHVHEFGDDEAFWDWLEYVDLNVRDAWEYPNGLLYRAEEIARECGWEDAKELAREVWGDRVQVYSEGRSGGWLVVEGLGEVEEWDAIDVSRWARFQRGVGWIVDSLDDQFAWHAYVNVYEHVKKFEEIA